MDLTMLVLHLVMFALSIGLFGMYVSLVDAFYPQRVRPEFELVVGVSALAAVSTQWIVVFDLFGTSTTGATGMLAAAPLVGILMSLLFKLGDHMSSRYRKRLQGAAQNVVVCCMCGYQNALGVPRCSECGFPVSRVASAGTWRFFGVHDKNKNTPDLLTESNGPRFEWKMKLFVHCVFASMPGFALAGLLVALNASIWFGLLSLTIGMVFAGYVTRRYADRYYESERFIEVVRSLGSRVAGTA